MSDEWRWTTTGLDQQAEITRLRRDLDKAILVIDRLHKEADERDAIVRGLKNQARMIEQLQAKLQVKEGVIEVQHEAMRSILSQPLWRIIWKRIFGKKP